MNRMYLKPITSLCAILFLIVATSTHSLANGTNCINSDSATIIKEHSSALTSNYEIPFEEKAEEQSQAFITLVPFVISYHLDFFSTSSLEKNLTLRYCNHRFAGNTPLYLAKRSLLI